MNRAKAIVDALLEARPLTTSKYAPTKKLMPKNLGYGDQSYVFRAMPASLRNRALFHNLLGIEPSGREKLRMKQQARQALIAMRLKRREYGRARAKG